MPITVSLSHTGTSTSNKMVSHSTVASVDIVVRSDRNCTLNRCLHAIIMTGRVAFS